MEYRVVPFTATLDQRKETARVVADQLEQLIQKHSQQGWASNSTGLAFLKAKGADVFLE